VASTASFTWYAKASKSRARAGQKVDPIGGAASASRRAHHAARGCGRASAAGGTPPGAIGPLQLGRIALRSCTIHRKAPGQPVRRRRTPNGRRPLRPGDHLDALVARPSIRRSRPSNSATSWLFSRRTTRAISTHSRSSWTIPILLTGLAPADRSTAVGGWRAGGGGINCRTVRWVDHGRLQGSIRFRTPGRSAGSHRSVASGIEENCAIQVLVGITGSGKTYVIAKAVEQVPAADPRHRPQQDPRRPACRRVQGVLPQQRG